jgi:general secretion pathway protein C
MQVLDKYVGVFNIVLLAGFTYLLADLSSLLIGQRLEVNPALPPVESLTTTSGQVRPSQEIYKAILERNIFSTQPVGSIAPTEAIAPVRRLPLQIRLIGTVVGNPEDTFAVIFNQATKQQHLYRLGDPVGDDGKLVEIERNQVAVLREEGLRETYEVIWTEETPNGRSKKKPRTAAAVPPPLSGQSRWVLDKQEVQETLQNLPQLLTKARVIPHISAEGKNEGFRIVSIKPDSFYQRIGLQNGDVIQQINGIEVKDPQTFMSVFNQLKNETSITLDLIRKNQKESFSYEIR